MKALQYLHTAEGGHWRYAEEMAYGVSTAACGELEVVLVASKQAPEARVRVARCLSYPKSSAKGLSWFVNRILVYLRQPREFGKCAALEVRNDDGPFICHFQELPSLRPSSVIRKARKLGFRTVVTVHNVRPHERAHLGEGLKHVARERALRSADALIVHSPSLVPTLRRTLGDGSNPEVAVIPHPVWAAADVREQVKERRAYLFFGHLRENKGVFDFVGALSALGDPPASIVGNGPAVMVDRVRAALAKAELRNCVFTARFVDDSEIGPLFAAHSVLVAPYTHFDAQSGVTHLAIAHGLPMVVTDVGGLADPVRQFGIGAAISRPSALPSAMTRVLAGFSRGDFDAGLARARTELSVEYVGERLLDLYRRMTLGTK